MTYSNLIRPRLNPPLNPAIERIIWPRTPGRWVKIGRATSRPIPLMKPFDWKNGVSRAFAVSAARLSGWPLCRRG